MMKMALVEGGKHRKLGDEDVLKMMVSRGDEDGVVKIMGGDDGAAGAEMVECGKDEDKKGRMLEQAAKCTENRRRGLVV